MLCFYHPDSDCVKFATKSAWAKEWGITRQRFRFYEKKAIIDGVIASFKRGAVPLPTQVLDGVVHTYRLVEMEEEVIELVHGVDVAKFKAELLARCTRKGDGLIFTGSTTAGMYREGVKHGVAMVVKEEWSGRAASDILAAVGVVASASLLWAHAKMAKPEDEGKPVEIVSPVRRGRRPFLPPAAQAALRAWALALRAMSLRVSRSLVLSHVNAMVKGTEVQEMFKHSEARRDWYRSWLNQKQNTDLRDGNVSRIELSRKKWCTAANVKLW